MFIASNTQQRFRQDTQNNWYEVCVWYWGHTTHTLELAWSWLCVALFGVSLVPSNCTVSGIFEMNILMGTSQRWAYSIELVSALNRSSGWKKKRKTLKLMKIYWNKFTHLFFYIWIEASFYSRTIQINILC